MIIWVVNTNASLSGSLKRYKMDPRVFKWVGYGVARNAALMTIAEVPGMWRETSARFQLRLQVLTICSSPSVRLVQPFLFILRTIQRLHETDITRWRFNAGSCARSRTFQVQEADGSTVLAQFPFLVTNAALAALSIP